MWNNFFIDGTVVPTKQNLVLHKFFTIFIGRIGGGPAVNERAKFSSLEVGELYISLASQT